MRHCCLAASKRRSEDAVRHLEDDCSAMWLVESGKLVRRRGHVTLERRREIRLKLREFFRLMQTD